MPPRAVDPARRRARPGARVLVFSLASDLYGVDLTRIREILSPPPITPVPRARADVVGVCSVRGLLVAVVDLRRRLSLEARPFGKRARILLALAESGETVGLLVDEVKQVVRLGDAEIEAATTALGGDSSSTWSASAVPRICSWCCSICRGS